MEAVLAEINGVPGVRGSFICDGRGEMIVSAVATGLDAALDGVGREVTQTMAALEMIGEAKSELDFAYSRMRVVVHDLAKAVLIVLCEPNVDISLLRLTVNVVTTRLKGHSDIQAELGAREAEKEVLQHDIDDVSWHLLEALGERR
jgi:predicted regulator of Ras-like GTPase activity (Roadblock/LC7/MglB family)